MNSACQTKLSRDTVSLCVAGVRYFPGGLLLVFSLESWRTFCQSHTALCGLFNPLAPDWMVRRGGAAILGLHKRSPVPVLYGVGIVLKLGPWRGL
jgi:hypothetical protein